MQEFIHLSKLLNTYNSLNRFLISVTDLSGIMSHPLLDIPLRERYHTKKFCDIAKSTAKGYRRCRRCRRFADRKAIKTGELFCGYCVHGLYEIGLPVVVGGKVLAVVYVGNLMPDKAFATEKVEKTCQKTGVDPKILSAELENAQPVTDLQTYIDIAETVSSYIKLVFKTFPQDLGSNAHWVIREMKLYARENFRNPIKLSDRAERYGYNEKYIGRLFKSTTDVSFSNYVNRLRLNHAKNLLLSTEKSIIEVALDSGFENVTYFNRCFKRELGLTPTEFRRQRPML